MTPAARLSAAIEVLDDITARRRPAPDSLKDWGLARRFAGSGDRAAIAGLVYDTLRRRASAAHLMDGDSSRAVLLGTLRLERELGPEAIAALFSGERFAPEPLTGEEAGRLHDGSLADAPDHVAGDFPDWIAPSLRRAFGDEVVPEMTALARRAPLDVRVNTLRSTREQILSDLSYLSASETPYSPLGVRIVVEAGGRAPSLQADPAFLAGGFEIQDEGSQLAAALAAVKPGETIVDLCAGGGGKTLALAAAAGNTGRIYATDGDPRRLVPIHARLERAGVTNVEVRSPRGKADTLPDLESSVDLVLVDAPCTGSGTWRRNPDAKWRLRPGSLSGRLKDQAIVLDRAADLVRPGGRIVYVTCSVLPEENDDAVAALLDRRAGLRIVEAGAMLDRAGLGSLRAAVRTSRYGLQMTPLRTGTDGFYVAMIHRAQ